MSKGSTLNLERFTTLLAQLAYGGGEGEILAQYGIDADTWRKSRRDWLRRLAAVRPATHETHVFSTLYARVLLELEERPPSRRPRTKPPSDGPPAFDPSPRSAVSGVDDTLASGPSVEKSPDSHSVDAAAFIMKPLMETGLDGPLGKDLELGSDETVLGASLPPNAADERAVMSPEAYARLACATHLAPSVMRARVHRDLGIADETHRAQIDEAMTRFFEQDASAYNVYLGWVAHLRRG